MGITRKVLSSRLIWIFLTASVLIALGAIATIAASFYLSLSWGELTIDIRLLGGCVEFLYDSEGGHIWDLSIVEAETWSWLPYRIELVDHFGGVSRGWRIPLWCAFVPMLVLTILLFRPHRHTPIGHCARCGYDLKGIHSIRCPECGRPTTSRV